MFVRNPCLGLRLWTVDQNFFTFAAAQNLRVADGQLKISSSFILKKSLERVRKQKSNSLSAWKWGGRVEERKLLSLKMRSHSKKKKKKKKRFSPDASKRLFALKVRREGLGFSLLSADVSATSHQSLNKHLNICLVSSLSLCSGVWVDLAHFFFFYIFTRWCQRALGGWSQTVRLHRSSATFDLLLVSCNGTQVCPYLNHPAVLRPGPWRTVLLTLWSWTLDPGLVLFLKFNWNCLHQCGGFCRTVVWVIGLLTCGLECRCRAGQKEMLAPVSEVPHAVQKKLLCGNSRNALNVTLVP